MEYRRLGATAHPMPTQSGLSRKHVTEARHQAWLKERMVESGRGHARMQKVAALLPVAEALA